MKRFKKPISMVISLMLAMSSAVCAVEMTVAPAVMAAESTSVSWNFGNTNFKNLGTITKAFTVDGLRFHSKADKPMTIKAEDATVGSNTFKYALNLGGSGAATYRSVSFENSGSATVKITARSTGSSSRTLVLADIKGNKLGSVTVGSAAELASTTINYTGTVFVYSSNSAINIYKIQVDSKGSTSTTTTTTNTNTNTTTTTTTTTTKVDTSNGVATITKNDEAALVNAIKTVNSKGGIIYINTPEISISSALKLSGSKAGGIVGVQQSDGTYPRLNFKAARDKGSTARGITVSGSNQTIKNVIVENAGDNGIWVSGAKNTIDHVIARYNNDSGIQLSDNADGNTLRYCYAYRNCDVATYGANADGFAPKLGASNTVFEYCFAWDNADDGWDSYDKEGDKSAIVTYKNSACWNNGNPDVFTGQYDLNNGKSLDKNMWTIQQLIASDSSFATNYSKGKIDISKGKISGMSASSWLSKAQGEMNGNGFKFGSKTTEKSTSVKRIADYCVAFDHKSKGFDNNNSEGCTGYITNCVSFNNNINYQLPYVFAKWSNNFSWGAKKADQSKQSQSLTKPSNTSSATSSFYAVRDKIVSAVYANKIPDNVNFDSAIKSLK